MEKTIFAILFLSFFQVPKLMGQNIDNLNMRLQGMSIDGVEFFNVDGVEITKQTALTNFSNKNFYKKFKNISIEKSDLNYSDSTIAVKNFCVSKSSDYCEGVIAYTTFYFIETYANQVALISFFSFNKRDIYLERDFINLQINKKISADIFNAVKVENLNFAGRLIPVGNICNWKYTNNIQCSGNGQMDWSIHKTIEDSDQTIENRFLILKSKENGKITSDEIVDVIFEGTKTNARKIIFDFTGVTSTLAGLSGGETLTIYLVSATVRNYNVSCVMSYWNNDVINESGLPTLLEQVMVLED